MTRAAALERAADLLARRIGLRVEGAMSARLERALRDSAADRGLAPEAYVRRLADAPTEMQALIDRITVQETGFFRDPGHFEVLVRHALPHLRGGTIWSAGCANGQEPWSLAMALEECGAAGWQVLATDVSHDAVARTRAGIYSEREVRGLSPERRARFLRALEDGRWEVGPRLRGRVTVAAHNLVEQAPPVRAAVVFCRNVLIYLDSEATDRALAALHACMPSDGWLFIGSSEALVSRRGPFAVQRIAGTYVHRPRRARFRAGAAPATPQPQAPPPAPPAPATPPPRAGAEAAAGEAHAAAGRYPEAVAAFRRAAYLAPADPLAHLRLGLALERAGEPEGAARAFRAARAALARAGDDAPEHGGWAPRELGRLLEAKLKRT